MTICHRRLMVLLMLLVVIGVSVGLTGRAIANAAMEVKTLDRDQEPVVVAGARVTALSGAPIEHLFVYTYSGVSWGDQIPIQVDEVTVSGSYTTTGDSLLHAKDEIVFMAKDLGDRAPDTDPLTDYLTQPISDTWYEIEVTDNSTDPTRKGWAYLVRSSALAPTFSDDYVDYTTATQRIDATQYEVGFATSHPGFDYLSLNGGGNILDRTKLRAVVETPVISITVTEDDLSNPGISLIKDGPVRVILRQAADGGIPGVGEASLDSTYRAYASLLQGTATVSLTISPIIDLISVRTSVDLTSTVSGVATFYNANAPGGVIIDGAPDAGVDTPLLSEWAQISHTSGRFIQVVDPVPAGGSISTFFRDDSSPETPSTGEPGSYGEAGFLFTGGVNPMFTTQSSLFVLQPPNGEPDNVGATYKEYYLNPLLVVSRLRGTIPPIYLPIVLKGF